MQFDPITNAAVVKLKKHFELIYGSADATAFVFDPSITAASLETWLGTPANSAAFSQMLATYIGPPALIANTTTWTAVVGSSTAMAAVIASSTAMAAVAASSTAMAAVAASSTAMAAVIASSTAMAAVAASSTALTQIFADGTAKSAFKSSTALTLVSIPTMTSNTTPSGTAFASAVQSSTYDAWKAFEKSAGYWMSTSGQITNQWLKYQFATATYIHSASVKGGSTAARVPKNFRIEFSDDNSNWSTGCTGVNPADLVQHDYDVLAAGKHLYWRLFCIDNNGDASVVAVDELQLTGFTW